MAFPKPADYPFWFRLIVVITLALFTVNLFFFLAPTLTFVRWVAANVSGFTAWLQKWQTMASASVALVAAFIAFHNTTRSIRGAREQETHRRKRKQSAVRAVLPIALSDLSNYAQQSIDGLFDAMKSPGVVRVEPIPTKALETLADFIEYSDAVDVSVVEATTAFVQIFNSRICALKNSEPPTEICALENSEPPTDWYIPGPPTNWDIAARIIDAASIYAGAAAVYAYTRRQQEQLPHSVSWGMSKEH